MSATDPELPVATDRYREANSGFQNIRDGTRASHAIVTLPMRATNQNTADISNIP
jgi:hypothetical protein